MRTNRRAGWTGVLIVAAVAAGPTGTYRPAADAVAARDAAVQRAKAAYVKAAEAADQQLSKDLDALCTKAMDAHNLALANQITALKAQQQQQARADASPDRQLYDTVVGRRFRYAVSDGSSKTLEFKPDGTIGGDALAFERRWLVADLGGQTAVAIDGDAGLVLLKATADGFSGRWNNGLQFAIQPLP